MQRESLILLAVITSPHGIRGEVKVRLFNAGDSDIARYGKLYDAAGREYVVEYSRIGNKVDLVKFADIDDRKAAELLRGTELYVERAQFPQLDQEEFYHSDLLGCIVYYPDRRLCGEIIAVHNFGAGDLIEIECKGEKYLVPFTKLYFPNIDAGKREALLSDVAEQLIRDLCH